MHRVGGSGRSLADHFDFHDTLTGDSRRSARARFESVADDSIDAADSKDRAESPLSKSVLSSENR